MKPALLSVITVTYQAAAVLQRTLQSVADQDYPYIEHILVDGASTDGTLEMIREGAGTHPQLRFISEPDKGLYDAMNKGLTMAQGDYVLFLNAGDEFADDHLVTELFEAYSGADVMYGHALVVDLDGRPMGLRLPYPPEKLHWKSLQWGMSVCHQAFIIRRELAVEYDLQYRICADIDWMIRSLKDCTYNVYSGQVICRFLADGLSSQHRRSAWKERYRVLNKHYGWFVNLLNHVLIVFRYPFRKKNYR
ncbi:MAG: glycosyltransferase family 2 protein [Bacteroidia bacterium]